MLIIYEEDSTFVAEIHFDNETIQISKTMSIFDKYQLRSWSNLQDKAIAELIQKVQHYPKQANAEQVWQNIVMATV